MLQKVINRTTRPNNMLIINTLTLRMHNLPVVDTFARNNCANFLYRFAIYHIAKMKLTNLQDMLQNIFSKYYPYGLLLLCGLMGSSLTDNKAQAQTERPSSAILHDIQGLKTVGSVMYLAAHPDDENTRLIAYLANGAQLRTSYLSLTRGDGGQNLIGIEKGDQLGILRTQELAQARKKDGGEQYFTRAVDFGYSKTQEETFAIWDKEEILKDVVWNIRRLRPDIIITRFPPDYRAGHGHHTASATLAIEAYKAAANKKFRFDDERDGKLPPWKVTRVVWNTSWWAYRRSGEEFPPEGVLDLEVGGYDALLGESYNSIASRSRSTHRSQGFGTTIDRGGEKEYFEHLVGDSATSSIFEDIDLTWFRFGDYRLAKRIESTIEKCVDRYNPSAPHESVSYLIELKDLVGQIDDSIWRDQTLKKINELLAESMGLWLELQPSDYYATHGDTVSFTLMGLNRSPLSVTAKSISFENETRTLDDVALEYNNMFELATVQKFITSDMRLSQPYWLAEERNNPALFRFSDHKEIGWVDKRPFTEATVWLQVNGHLFSTKVPILYKWRDRAKGEQKRPFEIRSRIALNFTQPFYLYTAEKAKDVEVKVTAHAPNAQANISLQLPDGWIYTPKEIQFTSSFKGQVETITFSVKPGGKKAQQGVMGINAVEQGFEHNNSIYEIDYEHIEAQVFQPVATAKLDYSPMNISPTTIGYIMGAGDEIPEALRSLGYKVVLLNPETVSVNDLESYQVVMVGIRAYNTLDNMPNVHQHLMRYVEQGGKLIVQYSKSYGLTHSEIGPYGLKPDRDRITDENAEMRMLNPEHPIFQRPNVITKQDFNNWVQERGLYFPSTWPDQYTALLEAKDPGEDPLKGSLLVTQYGQGQYIYTGLSFFRELPAGVTGAYKLMVNLIEY